MASLALGVKFIPTSGGTGDFVYSTVVGGYRGSSALVDGKTYRYRAENTTLTEWEYGTGVWSSSTSTLTRATVAFSSTGAKVSFTLAPTVGIIQFVEDVLQFDDAMSLTSGQKAQAQSNLGLGAASTKNVGTAAGDVVEVQTGGKLPALDGSLLTGLAAGGTLVGVNVYTSSQTITIPAGATKAMVVLWGGCGGASGGATNYGTDFGGGAGGGGLLKFLTALTPGNTVALTVGAGGSGGTSAAESATDGGGGGTTSLVSGTQAIGTLTAAGGGGGRWSSGYAAGGGATGGDLVTYGGSAGAGGRTAGASGFGMAFGGGGANWGGHSGGCLIYWYK